MGQAVGVLTDQVVDAVPARLAWRPLCGPGAETAAAEREVERLKTELLSWEQTQRALESLTPWPRIDPGGPAAAG